MISGDPAFFFSHRGRQLFCQRFGPPIASARRILLFFPPFAEEANRCRPMAVSQARDLAALGVTTVMMDYYGTGDSGGEFCDATIEIWRQDSLALARSFVDAGASEIGLWGLRFGTLMAVDIAALGELPVKDLLLWQPATSGKTLLAQFLRIRIAASLSGDAKETSKDLRARMTTGESIEVGGYELTRSLADGLEPLRLGNLELPAVEAIHWLELSGDAERGITPAGAKVVASWRDSGLSIYEQCIIGSRFWELPEITMAPDLIAATTKLVRDEIERAS